MSNRDRTDHEVIEPGRWYRPTSGDGYRIEPCKVYGSGSIVTDDHALIENKSVGIEGYLPLFDVPQLYRILGEINLDSARFQTGFLDFVNRYGSLGFPYLQAVEVEGRRIEGAQSVTKSRAAITDLQRCLRLWDACQEDRRLLKKCFRFRLSGIDYVGDEHLFGKGTVENMPGFTALSLLAMGSQKDPSIAACLHIRDMTNFYLSYGTCANLQSSTPGAKFELGMTTTTLLGAVWLQFANEVSSKRRVKRCESCRRWFYSPNDNRRFCGKRCTKRAERQRKPEAKS